MTNEEAVQLLVAKIELYRTRNFPNLLRRADAMQNALLWLRGEFRDDTAGDVDILVDYVLLLRTDPLRPGYEYTPDTLEQQMATELVLAAAPGDLLVTVMMRKILERSAEEGPLPLAAHQRVSPAPAKLDIVELRNKLDTLQLQVEIARLEIELANLARAKK